ncbi:MAG: diguanylate cyclase [Arenicellales bacterium]
MATAVASTPRPLASLAGRFYYFEDPSTRLTFADIRKPAFRDRFRLSSTGELNLGFTDSVLWLRIDIRYRAPVPRDWLLTFDYPLLDHIDIYDAVSDDNRPAIRLGDRQPFPTRLVPHRYFAVPVPPPRSGTRRVYVRIATQSSMQVRPGLVTGRSLFLSSNREELVFGVVYGLIVLMALYNLFLFFGLRDFSYLFFAASSLCGLLFLMSLYGHAFQYLWPDSPMLANLANPLFASLWIATTAAFARLFLGLHRHSRAAALSVNGLITLGLASTLVALLAHYRAAMMFASGTAAVNATVLMVCGATAWKHGDRAARFFTLAWIVMALGIVALVVSRFGYLPDNIFTRHGGLVGGVVEVILLSLALSDRYRLMHVELESYSRDLEGMVARRTQELEAANDELQKLSRTDPLTGVPNRRYFDETLEAELRRHRRIGTPLSLAMVDVDRFKDFNDRHGHPLGDECLRAVARALSAVACRSADMVARYGGEEFAVLLPQTDAEGARKAGDRILETVRDLRLPGTDSPIAAGITVSIGVTTLIPTGDHSAEDFVGTADRALYEAKRRGRDRLVVAPDTDRLERRDRGAISAR